MMILGDTHAAQGDSELAGTAMETSMLREAVWRCMMYGVYGCMAVCAVCAV